MPPKEQISLEKTQALFRKVWKFIVNKKLLSVIAWIVIIGINIFYISTLHSGENTGESSSETSQFTNDSCNVLAVDVAGIITSNGINGSDDMFSSEGDMTYSDYIKTELDSINTNENIKGILLTINSYGGDPGSAQEIVYALKHQNKPIVAVIRSAGLSAGYLVASVADKIYAYELADVGSIGVTMSYLDETAVNTKDGKVFVNLSSGKFKDTGNPDKSLTAEEKSLMMRDIQDVYSVFVRQVAEGRKMSVENVKLLADGSSMLASRAKEKGLIDEIGSTYDAIDYLSEIIGENAEICEPSDEE